MIGNVIGSYRIEKALGEGGMSQVFVGKTTQATSWLPAEFKVVLKVMSDELSGDQTAQKRFVKEAQILGKLRHRFITRFYEYIPRETGPVLVMEYVDGTPVDQLISEKGALRVTEAIAVTQCLLEALVYAHGKGITHRDIKPANLIRLPDGSVKVMDFGIAKMRDQGGTGQTVLTRAGFLLGTPHYMSPEQIREPAAAGAGADVYSAGVVLYEMLTGVLPFNSRSLPRLIESIYRGDKPDPGTLRSEIDSELEGIILRALDPDVTKRFSAAREFYEALEEYNLRPTPVHVAPVSDSRATFDGDSTIARPSRPAVLNLVRRGSAERHMLRGDSLLVGRDRSCSIVVSHPAVSRRHARLTVEGAALLLEDLKSANGTFVNESRIERANLKPGDVVRFGGDPSCSYVVEREAAS